MIGALIFSVIKKSRDAARKGEVVPDHDDEAYSDEAMPPFSEWFDDEAIRKPPREYQNEPEIEPMQAEKLQHQKLQYKKPDYQSIKKSDSLRRPERITRITRKPVHKSLAEEANSYDDASVWDAENFDLKRAIIYSEIIKRPTI
ncbi:hypothetical protein JCM15548_11412 [Geofilum rubicundum JCM 15548]|uniref:Uncharacterized protein n=2 Tax=Geofilum TaxID=1236988 RepID=A0A0E9LVG8_9BACT|nr:hypothetical protein JCM15548_11412 [Geofilum rubicundum JCM 15548]